MISRICGRLLKPPQKSPAGSPTPNRFLSYSQPWRGGVAAQASPAPPPRVVSIATLHNDSEGNEIACSAQVNNVPDIVTVNGWIRSNRNMKKYSFLHVADGTTVQPLQAVIPKDQFEDTKA